MPPVFLQTIENSAFSTLLRDSQSVFGYWMIIAFHAIGMGLLVGTSVLVALRWLGVARDLPLAALRLLYPLIWIGFWVQIVTGVLLMIAYPTKMFMTPAFYVKMACIAAGMVVMVKMERRLPTSGNAEAPPSLAIWSLALWAGALAAGRLIAYTATFITYPG
jgi:hypothetical protein